MFYYISELIHFFDKRNASWIPTKLWYMTNLFQFYRTFFVHTMQHFLVKLGANIVKLPPL